MRIGYCLNVLHRVHIPHRAFTEYARAGTHLNFLALTFSVARGPEMATPSSATTPIFCPVCFPGFMVFIGLKETH